MYELVILRDEGPVYDERRYNDQAEALLGAYIRSAATGCTVEVRFMGQRWSRWQPICHITAMPIIRPQPDRV